MNVGQQKACAAGNRNFASLSLGAVFIVLLLGGCAAQKSPPMAQPAAAMPVRAVAQAPPPAPSPAPAPAPPSPAPVAANPAEPAYGALPPWEGEGWQSLFDGQTLAGWHVTDFGGHGEVKVEKGQLLLGMGAMLTGVNLVKTNDLPKMDYEVGLDAMKVDGSDFFCGLTFQVGDSCCTFIVGGWGGAVVGISSLDSLDASENETTKWLSFEQKRWYRFRVRVTKGKIEAWIGKEKVIDANVAGKRISMRPGEIELNQPFGIATYQTTAALRDIQWRKLSP
jgi:hypothetical protein